MRELLASIGRLDEELAAAGDELAAVRANLGVELDHLDGRHRLGAGAHRHAHPTTRSAAPRPYLRMFGYVLCGWLLAKAALAARRLLGEELGGGFDAEFLRAKIATARFYAENLLPQAGGLLGAVTAGSDDLFAIEPKYLAG